MANKFISQRLGEARKSAGLTQKDVYSWLGIGQSTFSAWETGLGEPSVEVFLRLCQKYGIDDIASYFLPEHAASFDKKTLDADFVNKMLSLSERSRAAVRNCLEFEFNNNSSGSRAANLIRLPRRLPLFTQVATAGKGNYLDDDDFVLCELDAPQEADFAVRISGDSMEPLICDGDTVFIYRQSSLRSGEVGIFTYNGESYCKIWDNSGGVPKLVSINKSKYPPILLNKSDTLITHGKVLL